MTCQKLPDVWTETYEPRHAALGHTSTIARTRSALVHWAAFSQASVNVITPELVDRFRAWMVQRGFGKHTARNYHVSIRSLLREIDPDRFPSRRGVVATEAAESSGTIWDHLDRYLSEREVSANYSDQLRWCIGSLERFSGDDLDLADLTSELVNAWIRWMGKRGLSDETRSSRRRMILTLWRDAAELGLVDAPRRIIKIRRRDVVREAWTVEQVRLLVDACNSLGGQYRNGIGKRCYWRAYILAAWDSGLRGCDMRILTRRSIQDDGCAIIIQDKTGRRMRCRFRPATIAAINETYPPARNLIFPLWSGIETWRREARKLVEFAGLTGSIGKLRHSSGTAVELENPGRGHEHLGNTRAVFERHYLDESKVAFTRPLPPAITGE